MALSSAGQRKCEMRRETLALLAVQRIFQTGATAIGDGSISPAAAEADMLKTDRWHTLL